MAGVSFCTWAIFSASVMRDTEIRRALFEAAACVEVDLTGGRMLARHQRSCAAMTLRRSGRIG